jgi:hypothetical protein
VIGSSMLRMLQLVLGDRLTFTERAEGLARQVAQVADRFRWSLNCLADGWAARGRAREYAVVALPMPVEPNCWQPVMPTGMPELSQRRADHDTGYARDFDSGGPATGRFKPAP